MTTLTNSIICIMMVLPVLSFAPDYSNVDNFYGRNFLSSLFPAQSYTQRQLTNLLSRVSASETIVGSLKIQVSALVTQLETFLSQIGILTNQVTSLASQLATPSCPASFAATGKVIGNLCYTLGTTPKSFANAQLDCSSQGGRLVEPSPTTQANGLALYNSIKSAFGSTFTSSVTTSQNLWIGIQKVNPATVFSFVSTGVALTSTDISNIFETTGGANTAAPVATATAASSSPEAATLEPTGKYINELQSAPRNYICQYNAF